MKKRYIIHRLHYLDRGNDHVDLDLFLSYGFECSHGLANVFEVCDRTVEQDRLVVDELNDFVEDRLVALVHLVADEQTPGTDLDHDATLQGCYGTQNPITGYQLFIRLPLLLTYLFIYYCECLLCISYCDCCQL